MKIAPNIWWPSICCGLLIAFSNPTLLIAQEATDSPDPSSEPQPAAGENAEAGETAKTPTEPAATEPAPDENVEVPIIPRDLIGDEHVREEFGINEFTTPSIRRLFEDLGSLGNLPYSDLRRDLSGHTPPDRSLLALHMGALIADGFLVVQTEKVEELETVGRAVLDHASALGARTRVARHAKSLLEGSLLGDWDSLKEELAHTQAEVEGEMLLLRDADLAQLISLGGWVRALNIASTAAASTYTPESAGLLGRQDVAAYYLATLDHQHPDLQKKPHMVKLRSGIGKLVETLDVPEGKQFTEAEVKTIQSQSQELLDSILGSEKPEKSPEAPE